MRWILSLPIYIMNSCQDTLIEKSFVTGFWKISPNVTFYNSNIHNQNEERELPINLKVVTMCSSHLKLAENNWKYFEKYCNPFAMVTINCVFQCDIKNDFPKLGHIYILQ